MLTAPEQAAFLASVQGVRRRLAPALQAASSAEHAVGCVAKLHAALDSVAVKAAAAGPAPACRAGCAHCCRLPVQATEPELLHLAQVVGRWPARAQADLRARLQAHVQTPSPGQACAFLQAERWTVYDARPRACRKAHSLSASACEHLAPQIPQNLGLSLQSEVLIEGFNRAFLENHLPSQKNELSAAVFAALASDRVFGDWYQGKPLLEPTRLPKQ